MTAQPVQPARCPGCRIIGAHVDDCATNTPPETLLRAATRLREQVVAGDGTVHPQIALPLADLLTEAAVRAADNASGAWTLIERALHTARAVLGETGVTR